MAVPSVIYTVLAVSAGRLQGPGEISENIIYNNGYRNPDDTGARSCHLWHE